MKIGIGIVTHERFHRFKESFENLLKNRRDLETIIIVDDCSIKDKAQYDLYFDSILDNNILIWRNTSNEGIGHCKNQIMKFFYEHDYDWFFTMEDDINILNADVFKEYICVAQNTGIHYLNFGGHGELNKQHEPKVFDNIKCWQHLVGAFTLYSKQLITDIGYHDPSFYNALEHIDYYYRCMKKYPELYHFWEFPDILISDKFLIEQEGSLGDSTIRNSKDFKFRLASSRNYFLRKHGIPFAAIPREYHGK